MSRARLLRAVVVLIVNAGCLLLLSAILPEFHLDRPTEAIVAAVLVGALNALVWPMLSRLALPLSVLTLGLGARSLNGALVAFAAAISPGATIERLVRGRRGRASA